jgi:hypothetical protein
MVTMLRFLLFPTICATILIACRDKVQEHSATDTLMGASGPARSTNAADSQPSAPIPGVTMMPFDTVAARSLDHVGTIIGGAHWRDRNGENMLIVSRQYTPSKEAGDGQIEQLRGYHYVITTDSTRLLWKIQDEADNWCDLGHGLVSPVEVRDLDGDGVAENAFVYNVWGSCDVSPIPYKLMLHSGEQKYAVRGTNRVFDGADSLGGEYKLDPAFDKAPEAFRQLAEEMWGKYVRMR